MESIKLKKEFLHKVAEKNSLDNVNWETRRIDQFWAIWDLYFECDCGMPLKFKIKDFSRDGIAARQCHICCRVVGIKIEIEITNQGIKPP